MRPLKQRQGDLGLFIEAQRNALNETVTTLADKAGIGAGSLSEIERGLRRPRLQTLRKISGALGLDPNALFVRSVFTQELRPQPQTPSDSLITVALELTSSEQRALEEYLLFLRLRPHLRPAV